MAFYEFFFSSVSIYLCYTRLFLVRILIDCLDIGLHGRTDGPATDRANERGLYGGFGEMDRTGSP